MPPSGCVHRMREEMSEQWITERAATDEDLSFLSVFFDDLGVQLEDGSPAAGEDFKKFTMLKDCRVEYR